MKKPKTKTVNEISERPVLSADVFQRQVLTWYRSHGRKTLPWKVKGNIYVVWVSEIMLQQTQVVTVIPYFERFMQHFPDVKALAGASIDEVLHFWSGLGYYSRARNLHKAAQIICQDYAGDMPTQYDQWLGLPGIGRSTAGAILAQATGQRYAILDGNVKRVLCRLHRITEWPGATAIEKKLWQLAEYYTPSKKVADYTQAMMDLGATLCKRGRPLCVECPFQEVCLAYQFAEQTIIPQSRARKQLPVRQTTMLLLCNAHHHVLLQKRPPVGIWGGLWSLLECPAEEDVMDWCQRNLPYTVLSQQAWPILRHTFSHFHLDITPVLVKTKNRTLQVMEDNTTIWYNTAKPDRLGLPTPVQRLLTRLQQPGFGVDI